MNRFTTVLIASLVTAPVIAQETLQIKPASKSTLKYSIETSSEIKSTRKTLIDGEERTGGRNRGGGGGIVKTSQKLVFQQGPAGANWRNYITAEASVTRGNQDGEDETKKIVGALHGKKVTMKEEEGRLVFTAAVAEAVDTAAGKTAKAVALPRNVSSGVSAKVDLSGLSSPQPVAIKGTYDLIAGLLAALKSTLHPIRAARAAGAQQGNRRRQGGQGQGGQGQQGNRRRQGGRQRGARTPSTFNDTALRIIGSEKSKSKATGTLVSVEEKNGQKFATISIKGTIVGEGSPTDVGLSRARSTNRRGGDQGNNQRQRGGGGTGEAKVSIDVTGTLVINQTEQRVETLRLNCKIETSSKTKRTFREREMESTSTTSGKLGIRLTCSKN